MVAQSTTKPILVIQTAFLGDLLLSIPLLKNIRLLRPGAKIVLVCRNGLGSLFKNLDLVDTVYEIKKGDHSSYLEVKKNLNKLEFEFIFCPHQSFRSALLTWSLKAQNKVGFTDRISSWWNVFFFSKRVFRDLNLPDALRQLSLLGIISEDIKNKINQYSKTYSIKDLGRVPTWATMNIANKISWSLNIKIPSTSYICLFPGSVWATKKWTEEGFIEVGQALKAQGYQIIIMGGRGEEDLAERVSKKIPESISYANKTSLQESLSILKNAKLVITNDSAGQHMAAAVGVPTISIFGPTVLGLGYRPWNEKVRIVEKINLSCRPCGKHGHQKCPIGTHECMKSIGPNQVLTAVETFAVARTNE